MRMRIAALAVVILTGLTSLGQAASLDSSGVAENARWVAHLDIDAMRESIVVQKAWQHFQEKNPMAKFAMPMLESSRKMIGVGVMNDLHGVTLYGSQLGKHEGVLIVFADVDQKLLAEKAKKAPEYKSSNHGSHELHSWIGRHKRPVTGAFYKDKAIVFSSSESQVKAALDVLDGKKPSLTNKVLAAEVPAGSTVLVRVVGIADTPCKVKLSKEIESFSLATGEHEGKSFLNINVATKSDHVAEQLGQIAEGIRAMGMLRAIDVPEIKPLVEGMEVNVADKTLTVAGSAPAEAVWERLKKAAERHHKMRNWHRGQKKHGDHKSHEKHEEHKKKTKQKESKE